MGDLIAWPKTPKTIAEDTTTATKDIAAKRTEGQDRVGVIISSNPVLIAIPDTIIINDEVGLTVGNVTIKIFDNKAAALEYSTKAKGVLDELVAASHMDPLRLEDAIKLFDGGKGQAFVVDSAITTLNSKK